MAARRTESRYYKLEIVASSPALAGFYVVEFGLGTQQCYPVHLDKPCRFTQAELEAGPTCPRPAVRLLPE